MTADPEIKQYWDERAAEAAGRPQATTDDVWLRELEVRTLNEELTPFIAAGGAVLDLGCGDGKTVLRLAAAHPRASFVGVDFSEAMIDSARRSLADESDDVRNRVQFQVGDVTDLASSLGGRQFDAAMTDRCLINLPTEELQFEAIASIGAHVAGGGRYLAIENFLDGQEAMNEARVALGLAEIPIRWHNRFFDEDRFLQRARQLFAEVEVLDFSSTYYLVTRVAYSAMCAAQGSSPDYEHDLHRIAAAMPACGRFSPIRLVRMIRSTDAS